MAANEADLVRAIVSAADFPDSHGLITELESALVCHSTPWILDVKASTRATTALPNGPFPARAFVQNAAGYQGEIIVWLDDDQLSGLEYAWVGDAPPHRWPRPDELQVVKPRP